MTSHQPVPPESEPIPTRDWIPYPVCDSSEYLDRPPPQYARDDGDFVAWKSAEPALPGPHQPRSDDSEGDKDTYGTENQAAMSAGNRLRAGTYRHDAATCVLLSEVDQEALARALQTAISWAEEFIVDFIEDDYRDDDMSMVADEVIDWELGALRENDGYLQAACSVTASLYSDSASSDGTIAGGCCWCMVELAERPWRATSVTPSRSWVSIQRADLPVAWTGLDTESD